LPTFLSSRCDAICTIILHSEQVIKFPLFLEGYQSLI
jgi:hypothetical protein